jgi:DNA-directed RNA polymerase specialized sigma24 family protein
MDSIPGLQQEMIELVFFSGMTNLEAATVLGLSPKEVEEGLRCAILQLFRLFQSLKLQPVTYDENKPEMAPSLSNG